MAVQAIHRYVVTINIHVNKMYNNIVIPMKCRCWSPTHYTTCLRWLKCLSELDDPDEVLMEGSDDDYSDLEWQEKDYSLAQHSSFQTTSITPCIDILANWNLQRESKRSL